MRRNPPLRTPGRTPGPLLTWRSRVTVMRHRIESPLWTAAPLRIALLSDFHVGPPWTTLDDIAAAVALARREAPDLAILAGDFLSAGSLVRRPAPAAEIVQICAELAPPLGSFAILGNHDWKDCPLARRTSCARNSVIDALAASPIRLLHNAAAPLGETGAWIAGLDSQAPFGRHLPGYHDPALAYAQVPPDAPVILAAHEPDWFEDGDGRAFLQLSGHCHGGQANLMGWRPLTPSRYGGRYAWGHHRNGDRHLIVSGGIGFSNLPVRLAAPPEITIVELAPDT